MSDRWNEALEAAADKLLVRACGYLARYDTIYNGRIVSEELLCLAKAILALREADQRGVASSLEHLAPCSAHDSRETALAPHLSGNGPYKARQSTQNNHVAPDYVDGPNGFSVLCYGAWELAEYLNRLFTAPHPDMVLVPRKTMRLIRLAFLPTNPNRMRAAAPDVVAAAREFVALAAAEEARNAT